MNSVHTTKQLLVKQLGKYNLLLLLLIIIHIHILYIHLLMCITCADLKRTRTEPMTLERTGERTQLQLQLTRQEVRFLNNSKTSLNLNKINDKPKRKPT